MIERLKKKAEDLNISDFGVVRARVFDDLCLDLRRKNTPDFTNPDPNARSNPFLIMPDVKSLIVCLFSYNRPELGNVSLYAMGKDYHTVITDRLEKFSLPLADAGYSRMCFCDSWDLDERYLAVKAGLGFIGRNHMLIHPTCGSFVFIGVVLTNCPLEESKPCGGRCKGCGKCIKHCPGGALGADGGFDEKKCVSYISQKKGDLSARERAALKKSGMVWGCDMCQRVCPHNENAPYTQIEEFKKDLIVNLNIPGGMSGKSFKKLYSDRAFSWRGIQPVLRNQRILEE